MLHEIPDWLYEMAEAMRTQNVHGTAHPVYCVKERSPVYLDRYLDMSIPDLDYVKTVYANENDDEKTFYDTEEEVMEAAKENDYDEDEVDIVEYHLYEQITTHVWFFTEKEALDYIKEFPYRLDKPFMYVESAYNMESIKMLQDWIKSLNKDSPSQNG